MSRAIATTRWQFNTRWLFYATFVAGICAYLATNLGPVEAIGVGFALSLLGVAIALPPMHYRAAIRSILGLVIAIVVWGVAVDRATFREGCEHCGSHWGLVAYRVFGRPLVSWQGPDHSPVFRQVAEDLGAPCPHNYQRTLLIRQWGIVFYVQPCFCGTCCLSGDDWYTEEVRGHARVLASEQPDLGRQFRTALMQHNYPFMGTVVTQINARNKAASPTTDWGDLSLRIVYDSDKLPKPVPIAGAAGVLFCGGVAGLKSDDLLVNPKDHGVANVFVYLLEADASKLPVHPDYAKSAKDEVKMANKGCAFEPKAVTMRLSQTFVGTNPDPVGHNMKFDSFDNPSFNEAIGAGGKIEKTFKFAEPTPLPVTCTSHMWMKGLLLIRDDPYAAVSDASGRVTLTNLPAGKWNFRIWHERRGYIQKAMVGGKPVEWRRGQIEWVIKPGKNDLGDVLVKPDAFKE